MKIIVRILFYLLPLNLFAATNLIVNPDAESGDPIGAGWTVATGATDFCYGSGGRVLENQNDFPFAKAGSYFFYLGCNSSGEIYQNINISGNAASIDAGLQKFTFTGYTQSYSQTPMDAATITIEYRSASNVVLGSYTTGSTTNANTWVKYTSNNFTAPTGTRYIRIRLIATLNKPTSNDGYFDDLSLTTNIPIALPITLINFGAAPEGKKVQLNWTTSSESNNSFYTIERSSDAVNWEALKKVDGAVNSNTILNYTEWDYSPLEGKSYYRLRQTDLDGASTLSSIVVVNTSNTSGQIIIAPQPATDKLEINTGTVQDIQVDLLNSYGQIIKSVSSAETASVQLDVSAIEPGVYILNIVNNNIKETRRILISR